MITPDKILRSFSPDKIEKVDKAISALCNVRGDPSYAAEVLLFMLAFDQFPRELGASVTKDEFTLAEDLIEEEVREMTAGFNKFQHSQSLENLAELVDGAIDSIYVILWMLLKFNIPVDACFAEVHRSNLSKLHADGSYTKGLNGKVKKPITWTPPDLHKILADHFQLQKSLF